MSAGAQNPIRIALLGAGGRMGQAIIEAAQDFPGVCIASFIVRADYTLSDTRLHAAVCTGDISRALAVADVLVDFSSAAATATAVDFCITAGKPMVTGVTGLDAAVRTKLENAGRKIAILAAPNMSLGANLLMALTGIAAKTLGSGFDIGITDIHHRGKRDAPSGTALAIGAAAAAARGERLEEQAMFARSGQNDSHRTGGIGFASLRAGEIAGEHRVLFAGGAESLELSHRAASRAAFARGALAAARWIVRQPAGLYDMAEMLGLRP